MRPAKKARLTAQGIAPLAIEVAERTRSRRRAAAAEMVRQLRENPNRGKRNAANLANVARVTDGQRHAITVKTPSRDSLGRRNSRTVWTVTGQTLRAAQDPGSGAYAAN